MTERPRDVREVGAPLLIVADRWHAAGGGRERYLAQLHALLLGHGHAVTVLERRSLGPRRLHQRVDAFRRASPESPVLTASPIEGATHYQLHSGVYAASYEAERAAYDSALRRLLFRPALRINLRRQRWLRAEARLFAADSTTHVMGFSAHSRTDVQRHFGSAAARIRVERPGIDLSCFPARVPGDAPTDATRDSIRVMFVGHNWVLKGLRWALEAVAVARARGLDVEMVVAGRGPGAFATLATRLGLSTHVRFIGDVTQDVLAAEYRRSDLLLHPTFYDPFPRVIVEALASGAPVLTTRACGAAELIVPGQNGFVIDDPRDVPAIAEVITELADAKRRVALSAAATVTGRQLDFDQHATVVSQWLGLTPVL